MGEICPNVRKLNVEFRRGVDLNIFAMAASMFPHVSHLGVHGSRDYWVSLDNALEFCTKLATSYPKLTDLSMTDIELGNKITEEIVGYLRHQDPLKTLV